MTLTKFVLTSLRATLARTTKIIFVFSALFALTSNANAALVTWSSVQTITSNLDIQNPNAILVARNYGNAVTNINVPVGASTVTFVPASSPFNAVSDGAAYFNPAGTTVDANFGSVLDTFAFSYSGIGGNTEVLPFAGLNPGYTYLLQVFTSDDRPLTWNTRLDVGGVQQTIYTNSSGASTFANATITLGAGETSFNLTVTGLANGPGGASSSGFDLALVNALVLSQVSVPEPSTIGLVGLGIGALVMLRRRKYTNHSA